MNLGSFMDPEYPIFSTTLCYLEREAEQHAISFALGSGASYMEDDVRAETDAMGFCRHHYKMMYDY